MYRNILVPLDGSPFAEQAVPWALNLARHSGGSVTLVRVHVPLAPAFAQGLPPYDYQLEAGAHAQAREYIEGIARRDEAGGVIKIEPVICQGPVVDTLCNYAREHAIDLVVLSTHGRGPLARFWLGSVADELLRKMPMPVLAIRPESDTKPVAPEIAHVLVALDGSPLSEAALEPAMTLGIAGNAEYTLVRVMAPSASRVASFPELGATLLDEELVRRLRAMEEAEREEAEAYLEAAARCFKNRGLRAHTHLLTGEQPAVSILDEARDLDVDVIALASHGRGGVARLFLGSVADKVLRGSTKPVLLCHPAPVEAFAHEAEPAHAGVSDR